MSYLDPSDPAPYDGDDNAPETGDAPPNQTDTEAARADVVPDEIEVAPDDSPGERLDTGEDIGETLPIESDGTLLDAPASAVLDPGPDPITPGATQQAYHDRVKYEQLVNGQLEAWWETNRAAVLATLLAGGTVDLTHNTPESDDDAGDPPDSVDETDLTPKS